MSNKLSIIRRPQSTTGPHHLAGMFIVDESTGHADLIIVDEKSRRGLETLELGVWQRDLKRAVTPADGELYLAAIETYFGHSSDWLAKRG
jgi:hypothetical protein